MEAGVPKGDLSRSEAARDDGSGVRYGDELATLMGVPKSASEFLLPLGVALIGVAGPPFADAANAASPFVLLDPAFGPPNCPEGDAKRPCLDAEPDKDEEEAD